VGTFLQVDPAAANLVNNNEVKCIVKSLSMSSVDTGQPGRLQNSAKWANSGAVRGRETLGEGRGNIGAGRGSREAGGKA